MTNQQFEEWLRKEAKYAEMYPLDDNLFDQDHMQTEKDGEIVIHTGMYEWTDGTVRNTPDPDFVDYGAPQDDI